jgi:hypothetical protein
MMRVGVVVVACNADMDADAGVDSGGVGAAGMGSGGVRMCVDSGGMWAWIA